MNYPKKFAFAALATMSVATAGCMSMGDTMAMDEQVAYVDGAAMYPTTLVAAVKQAQLVDTLSGPGPFTVFAPTDEAFSRVPQSMLNSLMMDSNRAALQKVLTYHVVPGRITAADLMQRIRAGNGTATLTTVEGEPLTFAMQGGNVMIKGMNNSSATVTQADVMQSNGVIHVINGVLTPSM